MQGTGFTTTPIIGFDFDGTLADTFAPSPRGHSVEEGYRYALSELFGDRDLLDIIGGLQNRAPPQVIAAVLEHDPALQRLGYEYYLENRKRLRGYVARKKGVQGKDVEEQRMLAETLVRIRLKYFMPAISEEWPRPFEGVLESLGALKRKRLRKAIISSGHTAFIQKTFATWGAPCPRILVTDDDMRAHNLPHEQICKPSKLLVDEMLKRAGSYDSTEEKATCPIIAYVGDSCDSDRRLARNANIPFLWFNPEQKPAPPDFGTNEAQFSSWKELQAML